MVAVKAIRNIEKFIIEDKRELGDQEMSRNKKQEKDPGVEKSF